MSELREEVVDEFTRLLAETTAEVSRLYRPRAAELTNLYRPTPEELDEVQRRLDDGSRAALERRTDLVVRGSAVTGFSVFDVRRGVFSIMAEVYRLLGPAWRAHPDRTLGQLLKTTVPTELAQEVVGYLVWAGLCDPPTDGGSP